MMEYADGLATGLADTDADARDQQVPEVLRQAGHGGERAPDHDGGGDDVDPIARVGHARDGNAERRIERGEREAAQHAELPVLQVEFLLDGLEHDRQDLPVAVVEDVDDEQQPDDVVAVGGAGAECADARCRLALAARSPTDRASTAIVIPRVRVGALCHSQSAV